MALRCLVTDDEPIARQILEQYIGQTPFLEHAGSCPGALEALEHLRQQPVDILFLDINMPHLSGLSMLRTLRQRPQVIITTAYPQYAVEGFELAVTDYLLKPFSLERFLQAVARAMENREASVQTPAQGHPSAAAQQAPEAIFLRTTDRIIRLDLAEIRYAEAYGNYTKVYTASERHLLPQPLGTFQEHLPAEAFVRIHKSYLIAIRYLHSIEGNQALVAGSRLPIGKMYRRELIDRLDVR